MHIVHGLHAHLSTMLATVLMLALVPAVLCAPTPTGSDAIRDIRVCPRQGKFRQDTTYCKEGEDCTGGYEFELFNSAWGNMSAAIKSKYAKRMQKCDTYANVLKKATAGDCHVAFGSITAAAVDDRANLSVIGTSWNGALVIAVKRGQDANRLAATAPFSAQTKVIIAVICCLFLTAWVLDYLGRWIINCCTAHQRVRPFLLASLREAKGLTFFGTSMIVLVAIITVQLLFAVFSSYLTSTLLLDNPGGISSVADLKDSKLPLWTTLSYKERVKALGFLDALAENPPGPDGWYSRLLNNGSIGGLLLDDILLMNFAHLYPNKVYILKEPIAPYSLGFFWNRDVPLELLMEFERAVRTLWDEGYVEQRVPGLLSGQQGFAIYTFGSKSASNENIEKKFNVLEVMEFKFAFIGTLVAAGLVFAAELIFQIIFETKEQQAAAGGNGDGAAGNGVGGAAGDGRVNGAGNGTGGGMEYGKAMWIGYDGAAPGNAREHA